MLISSRESGKTLTQLLLWRAVAVGHSSRNPGSVEGEFAK